MKKTTSEPKDGKSWKRIYVPVWDCDLFVCVGSYDWLVGNLKRVGVKNMDAFPKEGDIWDPVTKASTISGFGGANCVVWFKENPSVDSLVHELAHATFDILQRKECPADSHVQEPFAYLLDFLFKEARTAICDRKEGGNNG